MTRTHSPGLFPGEFFFVLKDGKLVLNNSGVYDKNGKLAYKADILKYASTETIFTGPYNKSILGSSQWTDSAKVFSFYLPFYNWPEDAQLYRYTITNASYKVTGLSDYYWTKYWINSWFDEHSTTYITMSWHAGEVIKNETGGNFSTVVTSLSSVHSYCPMVEMSVADRYNPTTKDDILIEFSADDITLSKLVF